MVAVKLLKPLPSVVQANALAGLIRGLNRIALQGTVPLSIVRHLQDQTTVVAGATEFNLSPGCLRLDGVTDAILDQSLQDQIWNIRMQRGGFDVHRDPEQVTETD